ncbi:MAG: hypothetical protein JXA18_00680 [Chitinispirillaceae bacterium]|nr:hypothetical protein [Chitinispirillaceae bacterium]
MPFNKICLVLVCGGALSVAFTKDDTPSDTSAFADFLKSFGITEPELQSRIGSTTMFGGSSPVSFSGEGRVKLQHHLLKSDQEWMVPDRSYIQSGWEGNESLIRMGMVARAGRNTVLYSKIGFQNTFPGIRWNRDADVEDGSIQAQTPHDKSLVTANIHEDMSAGIALRTVPASFWLRMGNINWVEASPFTIWKAQPRTFAWEFLPYEIEQPIGRYYEYNIANGEKAGRAAWHKKPFNGIDFESISLPGRLYLNVLWAAGERYDNYEREYIDFAGDRCYTESFPLKGTGIGDSYRHYFHIRLARLKMLGDLTVAANFNRMDYTDDVFTVKNQNEDRFLKVFGIKGSMGNPLSLDGKGFYKEPSILSLDLRGPIADNLMEIHSDVAVSRVDTTFLVWKTNDTLVVTTTDGTTRDSVFSDTDPRYAKVHSSSSLSPAFYTKLKVNARLPFQADMAVIGPGFYSPLSFVAPCDAFYAFGSNLVGSGKFLARHETSPYVQNMAGVLLSAIPKLPGYGHLRVSYGQHAQLKEGRDILYIPYRLNGLDFFTLFHSSYDRWGAGPVSLSTRSEMCAEAGGNKEQCQIATLYRNRLGDESFKTRAYLSPTGMEGGGLYNDYLSTVECFVPYSDSISASRNLRSQSTDIGYAREVVEGDTVTSATGFVPVNRKFTNNFEIDASYDIGELIGYRYSLFVGGYAAINNVTTAFSPLAVKTKGDALQLWSAYLRFEPAIQLTKKFYLLGILGYENWRSQKAWMSDSLRGIINVPIDFRDAAYGLGFDWEILNRVGLHVRIKYMSHKDVHFEENDWSTPISSIEIKTWF